MRTVLLLLFVHCATLSYAQSLSFQCTRDTLVSECTSSCITLKTTIPDIKASTASYTVHSPSARSGCFRPYTDPAGTDGTVVRFGRPTDPSQDDRYTSAVNIGFPFSFFGTTYTRLIYSTNGLISFDVSKAMLRAHFGILRNRFGNLSGAEGPPQDLPNLLYDKAVIMGPYHDLNPDLTTSPNRRVQYQLVGSAPYRKWILTYFESALFTPSPVVCQGLIKNTHQVVLHEATGMIEVFIFDKQQCASWNGAAGIVGLQDDTKTKAIMAPGRAATSAPWGTPGMNEMWRFTPAEGASLLKRVELFDTLGNRVATGTTTPLGDGNLDVSFPNICSGVGITRFIVRSVYQKIDDPAQEITGSDTIRIVKTPNNVQASAVAVPTLCGPATGSLTVTVPAGRGTPPYTYNINGGAFQASNTFTGLAQGSYVLTVRDAAGCSFTLNESVPLQPDLTVRTVRDTALCPGERISALTVSNGTSFRWSTGAGLSSATDQSPVITAEMSRRYIVTATLGTCTASDTLNIIVLPVPSVEAGDDRFMTNRDVEQLRAVATPGTYQWTPAAGLSAANILNPLARPQETTTYTLRVTNPQGCSAVDSVTMTVVPYCIKPMEAFTPNGDGLNDKWMITDGSCLRFARVEVYNRYGNKVYESRDYRNTWDGTFGGRPVADGTYYYVISYELLTGKTVYIKGNVTILR